LGSRVLSANGWYYARFPLKVCLPSDDKKVEKDDQGYKSGGLQ